MHSLVTLTSFILSFVPFVLYHDQQKAAADADVPPMTFRILVEPESADSLAMAEALRAMGEEYGLRLSFASTSSDIHQIRILLTVGHGSQSSALSDDMFPVTFSFCSASVLSPDGKLVFSETFSDASRKGAIQFVARKIVRELYTRYRSLRTDQNLPAASRSDATATGREESGPGVYYKSSTGLTRLQASTGATFKTEGTRKALWTFGFSGIRTIQVYPGDQSGLQIPDSKPTFIIRGVPVSSLASAFLKLRKRDTRREAEFAFGSRSGVSVGYRPENLRKVTIQRQPPDVVELRPAVELEPGEYVLMLDGLAYEFGIYKK